MAFRIIPTRVAATLDERAETMNRLKLTIIYGIMATVAVCSVTLGTRALTGSFGTPPRVIPYRGYLEQNSVPVTGTRRLTIRLHTAATGGSIVWTEAHPAVPIHSGVFVVNLGAVTSLSPTLFRDRDSLFISVQVDNEQLNGRQRLLTTPHAMVADQATGAANFTTTGDVTVGGNLQVSGNLTVTGSTTNIHAPTGRQTRSTADLGSTTRRVCFLTEVAQETGSGCVIETISNRYQLRSYVGLGQTGSSICTARCITW